jgi:hypothetical protein
MDAELREQRIDCPDLKSFASALVPKLGSCDVISAIRRDERECGKPLDDQASGLRPGETLKQLLQHESGGEY